MARRLVNMLHRLSKAAVVCGVACVALLCLGQRAEAGVMVPGQANGLQSADADLLGSPGGDSAARDHYDHLTDTPQGALPSGTGASGGGPSIGVSSVAVLDQPQAAASRSALSSSLEERRLSLPASPVFDRLQPPRG